MALDPIGGSSAILDKYGPGSAPPAANSADNPFLVLLVEQLRHQDPFEPLENAQFIQQLASFSAVEETQALNQQISQLVALQQLLAGQNAFTQSASLVGQTVVYDNPTGLGSKEGFVEAVHLDDDGLTLTIDGQKVPLGNVTGILAAAA